MSLNFWGGGDVVYMPNTESCRWWWWVKIKALCWAVHHLVRFPTSLTSKSKWVREPDYASPTTPTVKCCNPTVVKKPLPARNRVTNTESIPMYTFLSYQWQKLNFCGCAPTCSLSDIQVLSNVLHRELSRVLPSYHSLVSLSGVTFWFHPLVSLCVGANNKKISQYQSQNYYSWILANRRNTKDDWWDVGQTNQECVKFFQSV